MNIDLNIRRIDNGFIVTGNDSTKFERYHTTLTSLIEYWIVEDIRELEEEIRTSSNNDQAFNLQAQLRVTE